MRACACVHVRVRLPVSLPVRAWSEQRYYQQQWHLQNKQDGRPLRQMIDVLRDEVSLQQTTLTDVSVT